MRKFKARDIQRAVEQQGHQCPYCTLPFGTLVSFRGETVQTATGDHFAPHSWDGRTDIANLIASCQVCNTLKSDSLYDSVEHARRSLLVARMKRRIESLFIPVTALTDDPEAWNREYMHYLSSDCF